MGITCRNPTNTSQVIWRSEQSVGIAVFPFILELVAVLVGVIIILNKYTSVRKQPIFYYISIVVGWYLALCILVLMPTDISMVCLCDTKTQHGAESKPCSARLFQSLAHFFFWHRFPPFASIICPTITLFPYEHSHLITVSDSSAPFFNRPGMRNAFATNSCPPTRRLLRQSKPVLTKSHGTMWIPTYS